MEKNNTGMIVGGIVVVLVVIAAIMYAAGNKDDAMENANGTTMNKTDTTVTTNTTTKEEGVMVGGANMVKSKDIVENAMNANNVTTVVAAVKAAGLVDTLKSAGPFTVFAPNNAAFDKLAKGTVETLLKPENKAKITTILTYHVVPGRYTSADLKDGQMLKTVQGEMIKIGKSADGKITVNGNAMVETPDVISSNGVTFVIDTVLMPSMK